MKTFPLKQFQRVTVGSETLTKESITASFRTVRRKVGAPHRWRFDVETAPMMYAQLQEINAFVIALDGKEQTVLLDNPMPPIGPGGGQPRTRVEHSAEAKILHVEGLPANMRPWQPGDFIQIGEHPKVYTVVEAGKTDNQGGLDVTIHPSLRTGFERGKFIRFGGRVTFHMNLENDTHDISFAATNGKISSLSLSFVEDIQ